MPNARDEDAPAERDEASRRSDEARAEAPCARPVKVLQPFVRLKRRERPRTEPPLDAA